MPDADGNTDRAVPDTGALPASGRFKRIEDTLGRIEDRVNQLPDADDYARLDARLGEIEHGQSPLAAVLVEQFRSVSSRVDHLETVGSRQAREAERLAHEVEQKVETLESDAQSRAAVIQARAEAAATNGTKWVLLLGLVASLNAVLNILQVAGIVPSF